MNRLTIHENMETDNSSHVELKHVTVAIGGNKIDYIEKIVYEHSAGEIPMCILGVCALPDIDVMADMRIRFTADTLQESIDVVRRSLITSQSFRDGFVSSIVSAITEMSGEAPIIDVANAIVDRLIGEM